MARSTTAAIILAVLTTTSVGATEKLPTTALRSLTPDIASNKQPSFLQRLFVAHPRRTAPGNADPIKLAPRVVAVEVPLPHLRPPRQVTVASITETPISPDFAAITASITTPPKPELVPPATTATAEAAVAEAPMPPPVTEAPSPPAVAEAPDPPPPVVEAAAENVQSDDLLGDPTTYFDRLPKGLSPDFAAPATIDIALPKDAPQSPPSPKRLPTTLSPPFELVRTLQTLQDEIAQGSAEALVAQRKLRVEIEQQFAAADPAVWKEPRNAEAAVTYVLSGGAPEILKRLDALDPKPPIDPRLITGVLAYAEGREAEAATALADVDATDLSPTMGAQVALAQSALAVRSNPQRAMHLLSVARLLAPGTLVEEAALRRELFVADQLKQTTAVEALARRYLDRFRHSVYAGNFRTRFAAAISHMDFVDDATQFPHVEDMLSSVEPAARCELYLTLAIAALIKGNTVPAALAAHHAAELADSGSVEESRARLYGAAALVADPKSTDAAATDLKAVNLALLTSSDRSLHQTVSTTLEGVKSGTDIAASGAKNVAQLENDKPTPLMSRVSDMLKATDTLLGARIQ